MDGFSACSWTKMLPWQQSSEWIFSSSWGQTADSEDALIRPPPVDASLKIWEYVWHGWKYTQCTWYDKYWHRHCPMTLYYYIVHRIQSKDKNCQELSRIISWTAWSSVTLEIKIIDCTVIHMQKETIFYAQCWSTYTWAILSCKEVTVRCDSLSRLYAFPQADKLLLGEGSPATMPLYQFLQGTMRRCRNWTLAWETKQNKDKHKFPRHASSAPRVIHISRRKHLTAAQSYSTLCL